MLCINIKARPTLILNFLFLFSNTHVSRIMICMTHFFGRILMLFILIIVIMDSTGEQLYDQNPGKSSKMKNDYILDRIIIIQ